MNEPIDRNEAEYLAYELFRMMGNATDHEDAEKLKYCLKSFSNVEWDVATHEGVTLLHTTASYDTLHSVKTLVALGMDPATTDEDGNTVLHHAFDLIGFLSVGFNCGDVVQWAVKNGFDINIKNNLGQTPLFLLARSLHEYVDDDCAPLEMDERKEKGIAEFVERFETLGGNFYHKDHEGRTFIDMFPVHANLQQFDGLINSWKDKMMRHTLEQEVGGWGVTKVAHKKM